MLTKVKGSVWDSADNGLAVSVKDFGAVGDGSDQTANIQAAINTGLPVYVPEGTYVISTTLKAPVDTGAQILNGYMQGLQIYGDGPSRTIFDNRVASGPCIRLAGDNSDGVPVALSPKINNIGITYLGGGTAPISSDGIELNSAYNAEVSDVAVIGLTGDGLRIRQAVSVETDQVARSVIKNSVFRDNDRYGIKISSDGVSQIAGAYIDIERNLVISNKTGGIYCSNLFQSTIRQNGIIGNGASGLKGGLTFDRVNVYNQKAYVYGNEFGNSNTPYNCSYTGVLEIYSFNNRFVANSGETGPDDCIIVGDATYPSRRFESRNDYFRIDPSFTTANAYRTVGAVIGFRVIDPHYQIFGAGSQTKYNLSATTKGIEVIEDGQQIIAPEQNINSQVITDGTCILDLTVGPIQRITISTTASLTITAPTDLGDEGRRFTLYIINTSGSAVTPSFVSGFYTVSIPNIANGQRSTVDFIYDPFSGLWVQIGSWLA